MKKTKRFAAAVAALALAISMSVATASVTAFAATPISAPTATAEHTFTAYPIITGTVTDGNKIAEPALVANGFTVADLASAAQLNLADPTLNDVMAAIETFDNTRAKHFAEILSGRIPQTLDGAPIDAAGTSLADGYYLILEQKGSGQGALTANILKVFGGVALEISPKVGVPTLEKKVGEEKAVEDEAYGSSGRYVFNDVADHSINEMVPFKIFATLPESIDQYKAYMYKITDTYDPGISVNAASIVVKIGNTEVYTADTAEAAAEHGLTVTIDYTNHTIVVNFVDITAYGVDKDSVVTVEYDGFLNANANIATSYEINRAKLTYSESFDYEGNGNWADIPERPDQPSPGNPGTPATPNNKTDENPNGDEETKNSDETPVDEVVLYTYQLTIVKTDNAGAAIPEQAAAAARFTVRNPDGWYVETDPITNKVTSFNSAPVELGLNEDSELNIIGLDDGEYTITEVAPPTGYRLPENPSFTVTIEGGIITKQNWTEFDAVVENTYDLTAQRITQTGTTENPAVTHLADADNAGLFTAELENTPVGTLPETGGIGTTMFYVLGGSTAAIAGTILIVRRRAKKEQ